MCVGLIHEQTLPRVARSPGLLAASSLYSDEPTRAVGLRTLSATAEVTELHEIAGPALGQNGPGQDVGSNPNDAGSKLRSALLCGRRPLLSACHQPGLLDSAAAIHEEQSAETCRPRQPPGTSPVPSEVSGAYFRDSCFAIAARSENCFYQQNRPLKDRQCVRWGGERILARSWQDAKSCQCQIAIELRLHPCFECWSLVSAWLNTVQPRPWRRRRLKWLWCPQGGWTAHGSNM